MIKIKNADVLLTSGNNFLQSVKKVILEINITSVNCQ